MKLLIEPKTDKHEKIVAFYVTPDEALSLMQSMLNQIRRKNPNSGREEYWLDEKERVYFSLFVVEKDQMPPS